MEILTHIEKVKFENETVKSRVQYVLGWTDLQYNEFQQAMGYEYLESELDGDIDMITTMAQERMFWSWWINHWVKRDIQFLFYHERRRGHHTELAYKVKHNPNAIVFKPQRTILRHSYNQMIAKLIDKVHHA